MRNIWGIALTLLVVLNCGKPPQTFNYSLALPEPESLDPHATIQAVHVLPISGENPYRQDHLIYRMDDFEYRYDPYRFWISAPVNHVQEHLIRYLRRSGLYQQVDGSAAHFENMIHIQIDLLSFEEVYTEQGRQARVALWIDVLDSEIHTLWSGEIRQMSPISEGGALGVISGMNEATRTVFGKLLSKLEAL
jgi:ABC-type uncharacterized transport system auxiliary subunit